jgi:hypothetical protein
MPKKSNAITLRITRRELATVLAALRFHQDENLQGGPDIPDQFIKEIATDGDLLKPLSFHEVSALCERLNTGKDPAPEAGPQVPVQGSRGHTRFYEVEKKGAYHEHWLAFSHLDAARRALSHAKELGLTPGHLSVSSMVLPENAGKGGLVYVLNDTRSYTVVHGRLRPTDLPDKRYPDRKGRKRP